MSARSQRSTSAAASRTRGGLTLSSRSATVASGPRPAPTIWRITPSPPLRVTTPACGTSSPVMILSSVVLPAPLAPTSATLAPSPTRNDTSSSRTLPSGSSYRTPATSTCPTSEHCPPSGGSRHPILPRTPAGTGYGAAVTDATSRRALRIARPLLGLAVAAALLPVLSTPAQAAPRPVVHGDRVPQV